MLFSLFSLIQAQTAPSFYFRVGGDQPGCPSVQTFQDGLRYGPCNGGQGVVYGPHSKYWAATRDGGAHCGETITMNYNGRSIQLTVMDQCPGCQGDNHVDMGLDALIELTGSVDIACAINLPRPLVNWYYNGQSAQSPMIVSNPLAPPSLPLPTFSPQVTQTHAPQSLQAIQTHASQSLPTHAPQWPLTNVESTTIKATTTSHATSPTAPTYGSNPNPFVGQVSYAIRASPFWFLLFF